MRVSAIEEVAVAAAENGLGVVDITASRLPGPAGNVEYFLWLQSGGAPFSHEKALKAVAEGPK